MTYPYDIKLYGTLFICIALTACIPSKRLCRAVILRVENGWQLTVRKDGSGSYGFGTGMRYKEIKKGTFDFTDVYDKAQQMLDKPLTNAEAPYIAISFWQAKQSGAEEHTVQANEELLHTLFTLAHYNTEPLSNPLLKDVYNDKIWTTCPWVIY
ncbi:MAG: hypothetical protein SD837_08505 [Candidatus Electrothrix scaldis]|nr:MAG: hypothetical protein SD837_08505 [Candidatus Electrothrix sp. GW3-3]